MIKRALCFLFGHQTFRMDGYFWCRRCKEEWGTLVDGSDEPYYKEPTP